MTIHRRAHHVDGDLFPEFEPFAEAVQQRRPDAGTWCEAWTVRDVVIHQTGNAEELARVLEAHLVGSPVDTRGFEEREAPFRAMNNADLWMAFVDRMQRLGAVATAARELPGDRDVAWTRRTMKIPWFAEHMREELVLHGWDITGDDPAAQTRLGQWWMTEHSVKAVGAPLLQRGAKELDLRGDERVQARLRVAGTDDVVIRADADCTTIELEPADGAPRWKPTAPQGCCCCGDVDRPILRAFAVASDLRRLVGCARCSAVTESLGPRCLHDHRPPMSQRAIGAQVDLHHDTAGQIGEAAAEVLGVADEARVQTGFG